MLEAGMRNKNDAFAKFLRQYMKDHGIKRMVEAIHPASLEWHQQRGTVPRPKGPTGRPRGRPKRTNLPPPLKITDVQQKQLDQQADIFLKTLESPKKRLLKN